MELCTPVTPPLPISKQIYQSKAAATKEEHAADMCISRCSTNVFSQMPTLDSMPSLSDIGVGHLVSAPFDESSIFDTMSPLEKLMPLNHDIPQIQDAGDLDISPLESFTLFEGMGSLANRQMNVRGQAGKEKMEESKPKLPTSWNMQKNSNQDVEEAQEASLMKIVQNHHEEHYQSVGCAFAVPRLKADPDTDEFRAAQTHGLTSPKCDDGMSALYQLEASTCSDGLEKDEVEAQVKWHRMEEISEMHDIDMIVDNEIRTKPQKRVQGDDVPTFASMAPRMDIGQGESSLFEAFDMMMPLEESMPRSVDIPFFEYPSDSDMMMPLETAKPLDMMKPLTKRRFNSRKSAKPVQIEETKPTLQKRSLMRHFRKMSMEELEEISAKKVVQDSCGEHCRPVEFSFFNVLRLKDETSADESEASQMNDLSSPSGNDIMSPLDELEAAICYNVLKKDQEETHAKCGLREDKLKLHARAAAVDGESHTNPQKQVPAFESSPFLSDICPGEGPLPDTLNMSMPLKKMMLITADKEYLSKKDMEKVQDSIASTGFVEESLKLHDTVTTVDDKMRTHPQKYLQFGVVQKRPQKGAPAFSNDETIATEKDLPDMEWATMAGAPGQALRRKRSSAVKM